MLGIPSNGGNRAVDEDDDECLLLTRTLQIKINASAIISGSLK